MGSAPVCVVGAGIKKQSMTSSGTYKLLMGTYGLDFEDLEVIIHYFEANRGNWRCRNNVWRSSEFRSDDLNTATNITECFYIESLGLLHERFCDKSL